MDIWAVVRLIWGLVACEIGVILLAVILIGGLAGIIAVIKLGVQKVRETDLHG